jgi:hypothetical protein
MMLSGARPGWRETEDMRESLSPAAKQWIPFLMLRGPGAIDMSAPFRGATSVPEQDWITVTAPANVSQAFWSPDAGLVYYVINSGGSSCLMARRLDLNDHPLDPPFRVSDFPGRIHPQGNEDFLSAVPGRFIDALSWFSFNVWMTDLPK